MAHPGDCLEKIALGCPDLKRLILCCWRGLNDQLLLPIVLYSKNLAQLSLKGIKMITAEVCEKAFVNLPKLRLIDLNFCDSIRDDQVSGF